MAEVTLWTESGRVSGLIFNFNNKCPIRSLLCLCLSLIFQFKNLNSKLWPQLTHPWPTTSTTPGTFCLQWSYSPSWEHSKSGSCPLSCWDRFPSPRTIEISLPTWMMNGSTSSIVSGWQWSSLELQATVLAAWRQCPAGTRWTTCPSSKLDFSPSGCSQCSTRVAWASE